MDITLLLADALTVPAIRQAEFSERAARLFARWRVLEVVEDTRLVPPEMPWEQWLRKTCELPATYSVEAASAFMDHQTTDCWRVTPVHLHAGLDHVRLDPPAQLGLTPDESTALAASISPLLRETGFQLLQPQTARWYLKPIDMPGAGPLPADAFGWRSASGRSIEAFLPSDSAARSWRRLLTEIQMTWFEHPVNEARQAQGKASVNSVWLDGRAGRATRFPFDACYSDFASVTGLAISAGLSAAADPRLSRSDQPGHWRSLLVAPDLCKYDQAEDVDEPQWIWNQITRWCDTDNRLLAETITPEPCPPVSARTVVLTGNRRQITLCSMPADRWKFWRSANTTDWFEWSDRDR